MKKLLSILGAITLIGTATTNVVACGGENPTPPTPDTKIDISKKIKNPIDLGQLSANTKAEFLAKLQAELVKISGLKTVTSSDYDVYKAGTTDQIQDSDITAGTSLNIKIVAKGSKFKGNKDNITTNYTQKDTKIDLSGLSDNVEITLSSSTQTVADFKTALINRLKTSSFNLSDTEVDIIKSDSTEIQISDIVDGTLATKVKAKSTSRNFTGEKNINVNIKITDTRIDISKKIPNDINLGELDINSYSYVIKILYLTRLNEKLNEIFKPTTITSSDYNVYKVGTTNEIQISDIIASESLNIKIVAKGINFKGSVDNITVTYTKKDTRSDLSKITNINSPSQIEAIDPNNVTKEELENALDLKVSEAIVSKIWDFIGEKETDYTYDIKNEDGSEITTIDLSTNNKKVKITITATATSTAAIGYTKPIDIILPIATKVTPTIYIDENGNQITTSKHDLSNINTKEIIQIGFFKNDQGKFQVPRMPETIEKVPDTLPSEITSLEDMFLKTLVFNQNISKWNTSNVTDMNFMFAGAKVFNQDISSWDTSNVTNMSLMFWNAISFNQNISNWNVDKVTEYDDFATNSGIFSDKNKWPSKFR